MQRLRPTRGQGLTESRTASTGRRIGSRRRAHGEPCIPLDTASTLINSVLRRAGQLPAIPGLALVVEDLHLQVRRPRFRRLVVFVIDTSDSMGEGPEARIRAGLGACLSLAAKAYLNRDQVCLITFRDRGAKLIVPPTDSVTRIRQQLQSLPVGGATPLAAGLLKARQVIVQARVKNPGVSPLLVLISDGEATTPLKNGVEPKREVLAIARAMAKETIPALVIDTLSGRQGQGVMSHLAKALGAESLRIHDLQTKVILQHIERSERLRLP
jgi:magnesium chelatase subunit D